MTAPPVETPAAPPPLRLWMQPRSSSLSSSKMWPTLRPPSSRRLTKKRPNWRRPIRPAWRPCPQSRRPRSSRRRTGKALRPHRRQTRWCLPPRRLHPMLPGPKRSRLPRRPCRPERSTNPRPRLTTEARPEAAGAAGAGQGAPPRRRNRTRLICRGRGSSSLGRSHRRGNDPRLAGRERRNNHYTPRHDDRHDTAFDDDLFPHHIDDREADDHDHEADHHDQAAYHDRAGNDDDRANRRPQRRNPLRP